EGIAGGSEAVAVGVESAGTEAAEIEVPRASGGPAMEIELVIAELKTDLDRVPALDDGQIIGELPAVDSFETGTNPTGAQRCVRDVTAEREDGKAGGLIQQAALVRSPEFVRPADAGIE